MDDVKAVNNDSQIFYDQKHESSCSAIILRRRRQPTTTLGNDRWIILSLDHLYDRSAWRADRVACPRATVALLFSMQRNLLPSLGTVTTIGVLRSHPSFKGPHIPHSDIRRDRRRFRSLARAPRWRQDAVLHGAECGRTVAHMGVLDDGVLCRLGKIFRQDVFIDSVRAAQECRTGERAHSLWASENETG